MSSLRATIGLVFLGLLTVPTAHAEWADTCPYPQGRTIEDLAAALAAHAEWLEKGRLGFPDRANFCNADLVEANLERADLSFANLEGASLLAANLEQARLYAANLEGADLRSANLEGADLYTANLEGADLRSANLEGVYLRSANLEGADLGSANLEGADLLEANLEGADLRSAYLQGAILESANLEGADLTWANLEQARLYAANLEGASLLAANLRRAVLNQTVLENARLSRVDLSEARYQPATAPAPGYLSGLKGLRSITFCPGEGSGLVQLRQALKTAGLRELEREATYTLESLRTDYALAQWNGMKIGGCEDLERDRWAAIEGLFRLIFFELATDYGLAYGRPILILIGLIVVFTLVYLPALLLVPKRPNHDSGIYRVWPKGRIKRSGENFEPADDEIVERLKGCGISALGLAFYFSLISAFHLGWRDFNVGTWISRIHPASTPFAPRGGLASSPAFSPLPASISSPCGR